MIELVETRKGYVLDDYESLVMLTATVHDLREKAAAIVSGLRGRTLWMVNSTAVGGGVAEMLARMVPLLEELGLPTRWAVIGSDKPEFFLLTKRLHNLIHGTGDPNLTGADRELLESVNRRNADALKTHLKPGDIICVHDPQPAPLGAMLSRGSIVTRPRPGRRGPSSSRTRSRTTGRSSPRRSTSPTSWRTARRSSTRPSIPAVTRTETCRPTSSWASCATAA
jgi:hypothetical protein